MSGKQTSNVTLPKLLNLRARSNSPIEEPYKNTNKTIETNWEIHKLKGIKR